MNLRTIIDNIDFFEQKFISKFDHPKQKFAIACLFPGNQQIIGGANILLYLARIIGNCAFLIFNQLKIEYYQHKTNSNNFSIQIEEAKSTFQTIKWELVGNIFYGLLFSCMVATPIVGSVVSAVLLINEDIYYYPHPFSNRRFL